MVRMLVDRLRAELHTLGLGQGIQTGRALVVHAVGRTARLDAVLTRHGTIAFELLLSTAQTRHTGRGRLRVCVPSMSSAGETRLEMGVMTCDHQETLRWFTDLPAPAEKILIVELA